ncbi:polysaccharide deacetylase family protein [Methanothrix sp.]|uniref:polysaccharide deacetylase family protein n=1 Tax=Methanothrix sp. TaxID=90426 RepID=UPI003BB4A1B4
MMDPILNLLDTYKTKATFFVLGCVAEKYPDLIEEIYGKGHEIACHGYTHKNLHDLGKIGFEYEINKSKNLLEKITGDKIKGFRAPTFSVDNDTIWALEVLEKYNFIYDSSIFPIKTYLYGVPNAPSYLYNPSLNDLTIDDGSDGFNIIEVPMTVYKFGYVSIPISGGFYFRLIPFPFFKALFRRSSKINNNIIYLHPWEIIPIFPRLRLPLCSSIITYYNLDNTLLKFKSLLKNFAFVPIENIVNESGIRINQNRFDQKNCR